ncbi:MAG: DUF4286 family protein [Bacteroidota bacterium]
MILYNVTAKIDKEIEAEWLEWMKGKHIPDVMATGFFESYRMYRLLHDDPDGVTYAVQYFCESMKKLQTYASKHAPPLQAAYKERYKDRYVIIRTLMESVD